MFTRRKVAVFIDGCFWHGCPNHLRPARTNAAFWAAKITANRTRDERVNAELEAIGWTVLRFWEHEPTDAIVSTIVYNVTRR